MPCLFEHGTAPRRPFAASTARTNISGHRTQLGVRHQTTRAQHLTQPADNRHHVRRRNDTVEIHLAALESLRPDLPHQQVSAPASRASSALSSLANTATRTVLPVPSGAAQRHAHSGRHAADQPLDSSKSRWSRQTWPSRIPSPDRPPPQSRYSASRSILFARCSRRLPDFAMIYSTTSRPMERAVPAIIFASRHPYRSHSDRPFSLPRSRATAPSDTCPIVSDPGSATALLQLRGLAQEVSAGGVLVSK